VQRMRARRVSTFSAMLLALTAVTAKAEEPASDSTPNAEILEFLGEWETDDGRWFDPMTLDDEAYGMSDENDADEP